MKLFEFGEVAVDATKVEGVYICRRETYHDFYYELRILTTTQNEYTAYHFDSPPDIAEAEARAKLEECKELLRAINDPCLLNGH